MEWCVWITRWFLFCERYSRLIEYLIKNNKTLIAIPPIYVYINRNSIELITD